ncbi:MAG: leucine--tRNA ligase [Ignavibacteriae bacterium HGW-Ignavibacteriae-1]|jgi:leucyl-tRNA synthetase|nr:MAG: leucine--tRNA ligase [Ignavibacteriae bacterium HGW-Ignavibacteriae-1]
MAYSFNEIEQKWQSYWLQNEVYKTGESTDKPKFYVLDMFPYPSGAGLHIGHPEGYTATDIIARFKRMKGFNVLHPMGFDAFGLPTERYSMTTGIHPIDATKANVDNFKRQLNLLGLSYDWSREINTTEPNYYKWTQWMFLMIYNSWYDDKAAKSRPISELPIPENLKSQKEIDDYIDSKRLAFIDMIPVNWCEALGTVLANEEVEEWKGKGYTVEKKPMRQWMLRITTYAERLLNDLDLVEWPNSTRDMQLNWIGRSEGAEIQFIAETGDVITVFTTRPDTVFGATYLVLAPEHKLVSKVSTAEQKNKIQDYIDVSILKSDIERQDLTKKKTGVFTGGYATNPASGERIEIWIADYVLAQYGTGAIMAVPGHDERDHEFAVQMKLPIKMVVKPKDSDDWDIMASAFTEKNGFSVNSENSEVKLSGLPTTEAISTIISWLEAKNIGKGKIQYKLRDWLFSRQRYWGEPIPIMFFEDGTKRALENDELPLILPDVEHFKPAGTGESPLANVEKWVNFIDKKTGKKAKFETNTMPQWAGSCWYYLRYIDPHNDDIFCDSEKERYWMEPSGVDLYVGGAEHAVLHLLYARFWHKVLFDYGYVSTPEPFKKLFHQGLILGEDGEKMSKSRGNVVNPDDIVKEYGADSLRLYEMFLGPLEAVKPWQTNNITGVFNFLNRAWRMIATDEGTLSPKVADTALSPEQEYVLNYTIKKVADDIENLSFNTAIAQMMIFVNEFTKAEVKPLDAMKKFVLCLAPFAPHIAEELWQILGHSQSVVFEEFPAYDETKIVRNEIEFVVQVSGKIRARIQVNIDMAQDELEALALEDAAVQKHIDGKEIRKVIFVKNKLINFIV